MIVRAARGPEIGALAARAGFDALYVDLEHSPLSLETTAIICTASRHAGVVPLVRTPGLDPALIARVLDLGAQGIIVPQVSSADEAARAVAAARFPPLGHRSYSAALPALDFHRHAARDAMSMLNRNTLVGVMLESRQALDRAADIAAVDGLDFLMLGAGDLAIDAAPDIGQVDDAWLCDRIAHLGSVCRQHGRALALGGLAERPAVLQQALKDGAQLVSLGSDVTLLLAGARAALATLSIGGERSAP